MLNSRMRNRRQRQRHRLQPAPAQRPVQAIAPSRSSVRYSSGDPFEDNGRLFEYEQHVKQMFARIETVLQQVSALQHENDFVSRAQQIARGSLGFELPDALLKDSWIKALDIPQLYAWCVFEAFQRMSTEFYYRQPLMLEDEQSFEQFLQECGFHTLDVSPCADGRLAHVISYVLRLPYKSVRRKSYAGAMFDVEDSLQKWIETEMLRYREGKPNDATEPTRYLKVAAYHFSSVKPDQEGCAAHGSDVEKAARGALEKLNAFKQGVENSFCCGASIDLLLIGVDTDTDAIRLHVPNNTGDIDASQFIDTSMLNRSARMRQRPSEADVLGYLNSYVQETSIDSPQEGMLRLIARIIRGNLAQVEYVKQYHAGHYADIGHQERFIGIGIGFEEVQLRNLTFFSYLKTVEEATGDLDVGVKIFSGLNVSRGLPIPVIIRYDYHGRVPGARERAEARCVQLENALRQRYSDLVDKGLLHTMLMVRDCNADAGAELISSSIALTSQEMH